ncbi:fasciclin domain-containing protein, partial [Escherichia coli]|nr:fasciclin domain-containing protein [Escherichia coli]
VQGEELKVSAGPNNTWVITDAKGGKSTITQADVGQSNGVVHVVDTVLMP